MMELRLERDKLTDVDTTGQLFELGAGNSRRFICFVLEDRVRAGPKVAAETAIPAGRYEIVITQSKRFQKPLPLLLNVPGFSGIRIHAGNNREHTEGCLLPGLGRETSGSGQIVTNSRDAMFLLESAIRR
ncbi:MAG: DUF5675 family protein, partial [Bosea sp. (in: a-proteobacteria)]